MDGNIPVSLCQIRVLCMAPNVPLLRFDSPHWPAGRGLGTEMPHHFPLHESETTVPYPVHHLCVSLATDAVMQPRSLDFLSFPVPPWQPHPGEGSA
jgi:hypothetical protein